MGTLLAPGRTALIGLYFGAFLSLVYAYEGLTPGLPDSYLLALC